MKRDMDLIRKLLLAIEAEPTGLAPDHFDIPDYSQEQIGYHLLLMVEAKLAVGREFRSFDDPAPTGEVERLTWAGHEFLDAARDPSRWEKAKEMAGKVGSGSLDVFKQILAQLIATAITACFTPKTVG